MSNKEFKVGDKVMSFWKFSGEGYDWACNNVDLKDVKILDLDLEDSKLTFFVGKVLDIKDEEVLVLVEEDFRNNGNSIFDTHLGEVVTDSFDFGDEDETMTVVASKSELVAYEDGKFHLDSIQEASKGITTQLSVKMKQVSDLLSEVNDICKSIGDESISDSCVSGEGLGIIHQMGWSTSSFYC